MKITRHNQRRRHAILRSATSIGVAFVLVGCDPAQSPGTSSGQRSRPAKTLRADKSAPVDQRVRTLLVEQLGLQNEPKLTDRFVEDLGADSLDTVELVMALEEEFNLEIPDEVAVNLKTLADVIAFINRAPARN